MPRSRMIRLFTLVVLLVGGPTVACAQDAAAGRAAPRAKASAGAPAGRPALTPAQAKAQADQRAARMNWLLDKWERQSAALKTLDVVIYRVDKDPKWDSEDHYEGRAMFQSPNLAYLDFARIKRLPDQKGRLVDAIDPKTKKRVTTRTDTIVCARDDVWHYRHETRQILIFPLARGDRQRALDEGPLPFLFNMRKKDALARYNMTYMGEDKKYYEVRVYPKLKEDQETFKSAFLYLDRSYLLPSRIVLISPDAKSLRDYQLVVIRPNQPVDGKYFQGKVYNGWQVLKNPGADVAAGKNVSPPAGAGARPRR